MKRWGKFVLLVFMGSVFFLSSVVFADSLENSSRIQSIENDLAVETAERAFADAEEATARSFEDGALHGRIDSIELIQGPPGEQGPQGPRGFQGPPGESCEFTPPTINHDAPTVYTGPDPSITVNFEIFDDLEVAWYAIQDEMEPSNNRMFLIPGAYMTDFTLSKTLVPGFNNVHIQASDIEGNISKSIFNIEYVPMMGPDYSGTWYWVENAIWAACADMSPEVNVIAIEHIEDEVTFYPPESDPISLPLIGNTASMAQSEDGFTVVANVTFLDSHTLEGDYAESWYDSTGYCGRTTSVNGFKKDAYTTTNQLWDITAYHYDYCSLMASTEVGQRFVTLEEGQLTVCEADMTGCIGPMALVDDVGTFFMGVPGGDSMSGTYHIVNDNVGIAELQVFYGGGACEIKTVVIATR